MSETEFVANKTNTFENITLLLVKSLDTLHYQVRAGLYPIFFLLCVQPALMCLYSASNDSQLPVVQRTFCL